MALAHSWVFKARFRSRAYGWKGSALACRRLKEAVSEIKKAARTGPVIAGDGVVTLFERFWPALEHVDSSSGALGAAVNRAQEELIPILVAAPADFKTRTKWLDRLWAAVQEDGVDYLWIAAERWGEICVSADIASQWADELISLVRSAWADPYGYTNSAAVCLSSLLAANRHEELWALLASARRPTWHYRQFGFQALLKDGRVDEAIAYAEATRGLNEPDASISHACETALLAAGRADEAYTRYALAGLDLRTGLQAFRDLVKRYPDRNPRNLLLDLAHASGDPGRYFAAAKDSGHLDLALRFAKEGRTDPRTLTRACRDFLEKDPRFSFRVGRIAIADLLDGRGFEITDTDVFDAYRHFEAAAIALGLAEEAHDDILQMVQKARDKQPTVAAALWARAGRNVMR